MGMKRVSGGLCQATVLGLEDQSEGLGVIRDEEEENNRSYWKKLERYCQQLCWPPVVMDVSLPPPCFFFLVP